MPNKISTLYVIFFIFIAFEVQAHLYQSLTLSEQAISALLHQQVLDRNVEELRSKLQQYPMHINAVNHEGYSLLQNAVRIGDLELVEALLSHGAEADFQNAADKYNTALHYSRARSITERLIDHSANPNSLNAEGSPPLFFYVTRKDLNPENIRVLLENGARTDFVSRNAHSTALHLLFAENMQYQQRMARRNPSQKELFDKKQVEIAGYLIEYGVDVNALSVRGFAALHHAARVENIGAIELLVFKGADIDVVNKRKHQTPMISALYKEALLGSVEALLRLGGRFDIPDYQGNSVEGILKQRVIEDGRYLELLGIINRIIREEFSACGESLT